MHHARLPFSALGARRIADAMARKEARDADAKAKPKAKGDSKAKGDNKAKGEARPNGHREAKASRQVYRDMSKAVSASALAAFACLVYALCASSSLVVCIIVRLGAFCALQGALTRLGTVVFKLPSKWLAASMSRLLPKMEEVLPQEVNCDAVPWPHDPSRLPEAWRQAAAAQKTKRPYFLNHVRGATRYQQAFLRVCAAISSVLTVVLLCAIDGRDVAAVGLARAHGLAGRLDAASLTHLALGLALGFAQITALFFCEVGLGWVSVLGSFEVFAPGESFSLNFLIDVVFHIAVAVNEELPLRGWLLLNVAGAFSSQLATPPRLSFFISVAMQAKSASGLSARTMGLSVLLIETGLFAMAHANSPGASRVGLINISVGGIAAALFLLLSNSLVLPMAWHFAWNLTMGNVYGLSTSGIPISATFVSVAPHPHKAHLHGGTFGPEQSPLAPAVYLAGIAAIGLFYSRRIGSVEEFLSSVDQFVDGATAPVVM